MAEETAAKSSDDSEVVKWYTRARKFPQLIGKSPDGTRLLGGPYTITQVVGGGSVLFVGLQTMPLWSSYGLIGNTLLLGAITFGTVRLLGLVPVGSRNPLAVLAGAYRAVAAPATGRLGGRPVRIRRPHHLRHRVVVGLVDLPATPRTAPASTQPGTAAAQTSQPTSALTSAAPAVAAERKPALTGVQSLLAGKGIPANTRGD